jgi:hypothetical protein
MMFPKKKWGQPIKSKTMHAEVPECSMQAFADQYLELRRIKNIRIPDRFFRWIKMNAPESIQKWFFGLFGGFPDNLILIPIGRYMIAIPIELKTQDTKSRAVGQLHGKQKHNALYEGWIIARSTRQFEDAVNEAMKDATRIRAILKGESK